MNLVPNFSRLSIFPMQGKFVDFRTIEFESMNQHPVDPGDVSLALEFVSPSARETPARAMCKKTRRYSLPPLRTFFLFVAIVAPCAKCQTTSISQFAQSASLEKDLLADVAAEQKRGEYTFYKQSFFDVENRRAVYAGSLYTAINGFAVEGCSLKIEIQLIDSFSGVVGKQPTGELQDESRFSIHFLLTREIANGLTVVEARPVELAQATNSACTERRSCSFTWLRVHTAQPAIDEKRITNHLLVFDGPVDHFLLPVSSVQAAKRIVDGLQALALARCP